MGKTFLRGLKLNFHRL